MMINPDDQAEALAAELDTIKDEYERLDRDYTAWRDRGEPDDERGEILRRQFMLRLRMEEFQVRFVAVHRVN